MTDPRLINYVTTNKYCGHLLLWLGKWEEITRAKSHILVCAEPICARPPTTLKECHSCSFRTASKCQPSGSMNQDAHKETQPTTVHTHQSVKDMFMVLARNPHEWSQLSFVATSIWSRTAPATDLTCTHAVGAIGAGSAVRTKIWWNLVAVLTQPKINPLNVCKLIAVCCLDRERELRIVGTRRLQTVI